MSKADHRQALLPRVFFPSILFLVAALALSAAPSVAQETRDSGTGKIEEAESVDDFEIVEADPAPGLPELAGRMHPALVHFPIGWITLVLLLDLATFVLGRRELESAGLWALTFGVLAFPPAAATGLLLADHTAVAAGVYYPVETHRNLAFLVLLICLIALATRWKARKNVTGAMQWIYLAMITAAAGLIGFVGHLGGKMVFGENYLPF